MEDSLDRLLAAHCSPALAGIKPASHVTASREPRVQHMLAAFGYPAGQPLPALLAQLRRRIAQADGFPHEIGLFLGYPVEDVAGFIRHAGRGCKLCGYWKVYGDAEAASKLFDRLTRVCRAVTKRVEQGESLLQVFAAA